MALILHYKVTRGRDLLNVANWQCQWRTSLPNKTKGWVGDIVSKCRKQESFIKFIPYPVGVRTLHTNTVDFRAFAHKGLCYHIFTLELCPQ